MKKEIRKTSKEWVYNTKDAKQLIAAMKRASERNPERYEFEHKPAVWKGGRLRWPERAIFRDTVSGKEWELWDDGDGEWILKKTEGFFPPLTGWWRYRKAEKRLAAERKAKEERWRREKIRLEEQETFGWGYKHDI